MQLLVLFSFDSNTHGLWQDSLGLIVELVIEARERDSRWAGSADGEITSCMQRREVDPCSNGIVPVSGFLVQQSIWKITLQLERKH